MFRTIWTTIRARLVYDLNNVLRWWSVRFNSAGLAILAYCQFDPVSTLGVWNMMPGDVRAILPHSFVKIAGLILVGLGLLSRVVKQPKLNA